MRLITAKVGPFRSIYEPQTVNIDEAVTVFVGMNEAGKTVMFKALEKARDVLKEESFDIVDDYPRKWFTAYKKRHEQAPEEVVVLTYTLTDAEVAEVNQKFHTDLKSGFTFSVTHKYDDGISIGITVGDISAIAWMRENHGMSSDAKAALKGLTSLRDIPEKLKGVSLTDEDEAFLKATEARIAKTKWTSILQWEVWGWLKPRIPSFLYFGEYDLLQGKMNLADLAQRAKNSTLEPKHKAALALLRMADISVDDLTSPGGYEELKAKIEAVSISLTDQVMEFWKQNEEIEVEVDIKADPQDVAPFNNGANLYLRIKNRRHRGVSTSFEQRSRGFVWFFSFLVWFDSVQNQIEAAGEADTSQIILLLDEPGLALHALAQADFLRYIDDLAKRHQVLYTTHSPFMVHSDRMHQIRMVEDKVDVGTTISDNLSGSDPRTIFPLQAALGWTIAQNLFISERNLLVEGPSDLIYLKMASSLLEAQGKKGLREDITIVPTGGLDKVVTFVALLGANGLKLAVLHDYHGTPEQKLMDLVKQKMISAKAVLNVAQYRDVAQLGTVGKSADTEDLFDTALYLEHFNAVFAAKLGAAVKESDLPAGERIVDRLERFAAKKIRPSGGFNHYTVASHFASNPPATLDDDTVKRFEALFKTVNGLFA